MDYLVPVSRFIHTYLNTKLYFALVPIIAIFLYLYAPWAVFVKATSSLLLAIATVGGLKFVVRKPRPEGALADEETSSFPSGHAACASALAGTLFFTLPTSELFWVYVGVGGFVALIVSASRYVLNLHTPLEIGAGLLLGVGIPTLIFTLF